MWEVNWTHELTTGTFAWARNPSSYYKKSRDWHLVATGSLRKAGVNTPTYRKDSWEVDWNKRNGKKVWARNKFSHSPKAREWHWIDHKTMDYAGLKWKPAITFTGRKIDSCGYVTLTRVGLTEEEIKIAEENNLFLGSKKGFLKEHRLVALKKYGLIPNMCVVRHINGIKDDNRPENLVLGTTQENTMDHNTARITAMIMREKYENIINLLNKIKPMVHDGTALQMIERALNE